MRIDLNGNWKLTGDSAELTGAVPGCNYLSLLAAEMIEDPFYGLNEQTAYNVALKDWIYSREFEVSLEVLKKENIFLCAKGIDTIAEIFINGWKVANCANAYRTYRFDIKKYLVCGKNNIEVVLYSPIKYAKKCQKEYRLPQNPMNSTGSQHIRKPAYHFGWDWAPKLPLSGITGDIYIDAYSSRFKDIRITQEKNGTAVNVKVNALVEGAAENLSVELILTPPQNNALKVECALSANKTAALCATVDNPELWFPNGLGGQPLYKLILELKRGRKSEDKRSFEIGIRTIELDLSPDKYGSNFCFVVNGVPIFAKGANWAPTDSFVNRTSPERLEDYIRTAANAGMNMLRVWGGGYYESDLFYSLCDRYGILVWQDFCFACYPYPFMNKGFLENVLAEARDNVRRLRHHASLALWCGNNEVEAILPAYIYRYKLVKAQKDFYYGKLAELVREEDGITPYRAGSPGSGKFMRKVGSDDVGDTHLWHVWHGLRRPEYYRSRPSRFISEFGMESLPTLHCIKSFCEQQDMELRSPVIASHQKTAGGIGKILYYLLLDHRYPDNFAHLVYLSNLAQAQIIEKEVLCWRRNPRTHGTLIWQYNDCWPVCSDSCIDYTDSFKALYYFAKRFFAPVVLSIERSGRRISIYAVNDRAEAFKGMLKWEVKDFNGGLLAEYSESAEILPYSSQKFDNIKLSASFYGKYAKTSYLTAELYDSQGNIAAIGYVLFVPDKKARLIKPNFRISAEEDERNLTIRIKSNCFARGVCAEIEGLPSRFDNNYADIPPGGELILSRTLPEGWDIERVMHSLSVTSVADINPLWSRVKEKIFRASVIFNIHNLAGVVGQLLN